MQKPLLPIGYHLKGGMIISRISRILNCEIYQLESNKYVYVFTDLSIADIINSKLKQYEYEIVSIGLDDYLCITNLTFDSSIIEKIKKSLTNHIGFECISGMEDLKKALYEEVISPLKEPEKYKKYKLSIPNGILFFGPPGCGKTFISRKLAEEMGYNFYEIKHSDISSPYIHGSTGMIGEIFKMAIENKPSIVFFDEISGLVPKRENLSGNQQYKEEEVNELLMRLNDAGKNQILVIGATNFPDRIDSAIMRSGRMDKRIFIGPPDFAARIELFQLYLKERPIDHINYAELAIITDLYVTADIEALCDNFARKGLSLNSNITMDICLKCIENFKPSLTLEQLEGYQIFMENYQRL